MLKTAGLDDTSDAVIPFSAFQKEKSPISVGIFPRSAGAPGGRAGLNCDVDTITLKVLFHRGQECIALVFPSSPALNGLVMQLSAVRFSKTHRCFYMPLLREHYEALTRLLEGKAQLVTEELRAYLARKQEQPDAQKAFPVPEEIRSVKGNAQPGVPAAIRISRENAEELQKFIRHLKLKAYSASTLRTYQSEFMQLLQVLGERRVQDLTPDQIKNYMVWAMERGGISEHTAHSRINALKFYYEQVLGRAKFFWEVPRPKKPVQLPKVFSKEEVAAIINSLTNVKHKTMLMLCYSAGLRVSEVVQLRTSNIDSRRMTILIEAAKGKKDRLAILSPVLLVMLREYLRTYQPDPDGFLFEGQEKGWPYSSRSLQEVLQAAKHKAGVIRRGSIHSLRHSFATHLIEKGTDVTMIQKLLGHNDLRTTLRYLHTSNRDLLKIMSPLDDLQLGP